MSTSQSSVEASEASALRMDRDRIKAQMQTLQEHLVKVETEFTDDAVKRDAHITILQQELQSSKDKLQQEINKLVKDNTQLQTQLDLLESEIIKARTGRDGFEKQVAEANSEIERLTLSLSNLQSVLQNFDTERESAVLLTRAEDAREVDSLKEQLKIATEIAIAHRECSQRISTLESSVSALQGDLHTSRGLASAFQHDVVRLQAYVNELQAKFHKMDANLVDKELIRNMVWCLAFH